MSRPRVVVTGMGAACATGKGIDALWRAARDGQSAVGPLEFERPGSNQIKLAAQIKCFAPESYVEAKVLPFCDRYAQLAIVAADEALSQAGLAREERQGPTTAVILGTGVGGITTIDEQCYSAYATKSRLNPLAIPRIMSSAATSHLSIRYGCTGPTFTITSACASSAQAIGVGTSLVRSGAVERAIVGGSESSMTALNIRTWELLRVLTPDACRPFSTGRNGMVLGEGAAIMVIEKLETARRRNVEPLAEIVGYGTSSDAFDIVRPDPNGARSAIEQAIADAGLTPGDIDYVNAHGTGTVANDIAEAEALQRVFGDRLPRLAVSSTKPIHGHALGAGGAIELAITIMAMRDNIAPPTINWLGADAKCGIDPVANAARAMPIRVAISNSFAFGGVNACLAVARAD
ncbi:beta-ketoacyl-[acyl-carrier-protein] synthase family protein [Bradyrhizobium sp. SZCCHNRI20481]|uniref:beta-ketoacyl-[acyl-carrier-protein] synthase family protein n=1 Tax=Bradyrhizobium sp. SZCCHNRI20481 TaxID=3057286 RepID=UPI002915CDEA|nr:beta-ketoacyl-[acyl-carrier-protein] synthase family protein [Bradyrhizobium sp. SZCCHNRI20481]